MQNRNEIDELVLTWISDNAGTFVADGFTAQQVTGQVEPQVLDALWRLVATGVVRPSTSVPQFNLTAVGAEIIQGSNSPYYSDSFYQNVLQLAPKLDTDALGYFKFALDCLKIVPPGALALFRAALEAELWSLIDACEANSRRGRIPALHRRNLGERISGLVTHIRSKQVIDEDDLHEFDASCTQIRISDHKILHPQGGFPHVDATQITATSHSFRKMAEVSTNTKTALENSP